jgi:dolichyl-phosphate-mannose-protein mannosyltransferase
MSRVERHFLLPLLVLAAALHLFQLSEPRSLVFDEVHFGGFVEAYCCSGEYVFDIHPPHAKLLIAGAVALGGYRGGQEYGAIHDSFTAVSPALIRLVPALAGSAIPLVFYGLLLQLGARPAAAFLGGLALLLDNAMLLQTRLVTLDGVLLVATLGAIVACLAGLRSRRRASATGWALLAGALAGLAIGSKFTGLVSLGLIALVLGVHLALAPGAARFRQVASLAVWILSGAVAVYTAGWLLHYALLTEPGEVTSPATGDFLADVVALHRQMLTTNYGITTAHPSSSPWWSWPLMMRPLFYWTGATGTLRFVGNPVVWWGSTLGLFVVAAAWLLPRTTDLRLSGGARAWPPRLWIPLAGYLLSFAPLTVVPRPLFLYHYLTPLAFGLCVVILWLDHAGWTRPGGLRGQRLSYGVAVLLLAAGFVAVSPFTFAFLSAPAYQQAVFTFLPGWR